MFLSHETHLHYRATSRLVYNSSARERDLGRSFLRKKSRFSQVMCKGQLRNSCMPLARSCQTASFTMKNGFSFRWCHPILKNKNKESSVLNHNIFTSIGNTAYYTLDSSLTLTHFMRMHYPIKIRIKDYHFAKIHPSVCPHRTSLHQLGKIVKN
jgi:hypothetical protein